MWTHGKGIIRAGHKDPHMLIIPIGRDDAEIRRHAWISYAIIAVNVVVFIVLGIFEQSASRAFQSRFRETIEYQVEHPYLQTPKELEQLIGPVGMAHVRKMRDEYGHVAASRIVREQATLDRLCRLMMEARDKHPRVKLSYVSARGGVLTIFTAMFVHAGFLHLIGNLLFFFLSGPFIEDVFGRPLFAFLYFAGGAAATLTYASLHPDSLVAAMGASGAIAAVMGAYLVRFATSRIEFLLIPFWWRPMFNFRFWVPAFVVLPLWFGEQLLQMHFVEDAGGGVAFSAHVGGFVFGAVVALIVKLTKFEETYVNPKVVAQTTWSMDPRLMNALEARKFGNLEGAQQALDQLLRDPKSPTDAYQVAMDVALETEDYARYDLAATRLLARHVEAKDQDLAMDLIREVTTDRNARIPKFLARAAPIVERTGDRDWALTLYERLYDSDPVSVSAVSSLVKIGTLRRAHGDISGAREALTKARTHPACSAEWLPSIEAKLSQLR